MNITDLRPLKRAWFLADSAMELANESAMPRREAVGFMDDFFALVEQERDRVFPENEGECSVNVRLPMGGYDAGAGNNNAHQGAR
jgi:hypothetical protein